MTEPKAPEGAALPTLEQLAAACQLRHRQLVELYLMNGLNARKAGRDLGYKNPTEGTRILRRPDVAAYMDALFAARQLGTNAILTRLEYLAAADMSNFIRVAPTERSYWVRASEHDEVRDAAKRRGITADAFDEHDLSGLFGSDRVAQTESGVLMIEVSTIEAEVLLDWRAAEQAQVLGHIRKLKVSKNGQVEFELHDANKSLELLGKAQRMFVERQEISGPDGEPLKLYASVDVDKV